MAGTILRWIQEDPGLEVYWVVFSSNRERKKEASRSADLFLKGAYKKKVFIESFRDGFFPYQGAEIKEYFESVKKQVSRRTSS